MRVIAKAIADRQSEIERLQETGSYPAYARCGWAALSCHRPLQPSI